MEFAELQQTIEEWIKGYKLDPAEQLSEQESGLFYNLDTEEGFELSYGITNNEKGILTLRLEASICPMTEKNFPVLGRLFTSNVIFMETMYKPIYRNGRAGWTLVVPAGDLPAKERVTEWLESFYRTSLEEANRMIQHGFLPNPKAA